ncbi:MAG: SCO family protein [Verrucomicrobia bacterium]|nr:SCO family protein [Verrucomicrobiota bacterium]
MIRSVLARQSSMPLAALFLLAGCGPAPTPPPEIRSYREVGEFSLTDQNGNAITAQNLLGKVWVANFIFTSCTAECLVLSKHMANLQERFRGDDRVAFVSFSVDPGTDQPARLAKYADLFDAGARWSFLTGEPAAVETLIKERFLLPVAQSSAESLALQKALLIHSDRFAVVDRKGVVRAYVQGMRSQAEDEVAQVVSHLLVE